MTDAAGRPLTPCAHIGAHSNWRTERALVDKRQPPICNRTRGHEGPHQHVNARTFGVEAEW